MATHDEGTVPDQTKPGLGKKISPARNVTGVVVLILLSAVALKEWDANRQSNAGIAKLNQALAVEDGDVLSMDPVESLIGRKSDGPGVADGEVPKFTYEWRGAFRRYPLTDIFTNKSKPALLRAE